MTPLGIGFIGSGFNAQFHIRSWTGVRDADVLGVWSPNQEHAAATARYARKLDVGRARPYASIADMVADPAINAIWLCGPNQARIENVEEIVDAIARGKETGLSVARALAGTAGEPAAAEVPATVNPMRFLLDTLLGDGLIVVAVKTRFLGSGASVALLSVLRQVMPAHVAMLVVSETLLPVDSYTGSSGSPEDGPAEEYLVSASQPSDALTLDGTPGYAELTPRANLIEV